MIQNRRFIGFAFVLAACSSFGQTFFIGLFGDDLREAFALSKGRFGTLYSLATLTSGACVIWVGRLIDRVDLRIYSTAVCLGLVAGCLALAQARSALLLVPALFALRLFGQGLLSHTAMTTMSRYFEAERGKAMSLAGLGFPAGEAVLPLAAVALIAAVGWRGTWQIVGAAVALLVLPAGLYLLRGHAARHRAFLAGLGSSQDATAKATTAPREAPRQWTRSDVIRDPRFHLILPAVLAPGFIVTGFFIHQGTLIEAKGWTATWFAACFVGFAAAQLPSSLLAGPLVDRVGAARLLPILLLPLGAALVTLAVSDHPGVALVFLVMAGLTSGLGGPIVGAMWAELYGVLHLGAIRALATALMVLATAISPAAMGLLIDARVSIDAIALLCLGYVVAGTGLVVPVVRRHLAAARSDHD